MVLYLSIVDTGLPLAEHGSVLFLVLIDFSLILQLGQLSSSLFVHFFLKVSSLDSVLLVHLLQNIHLVILSICLFLCSSSLELSVLLSNGSFNLILLILFEPFHFFLLLLLQKDVLFSRLINVFQQVNPGLLFSLPLGFSHLVLSLCLLLDELINQFFICFFIIS